MSYFFTTLAVGEPYFAKSLEAYTTMHEKTQEGFFNITTSQADLETIQDKTGLTLVEFQEKYPKLQITTVEQFMGKCTFPYHMEGYGFTFNLNMKVLSLKACLQSGKDFDYLIFADGDWSIHENFAEEKLKAFFANLEALDVDIAFERPAQIGNYRANNFHDCFFDEKLKDYNVYEHTVWDEAHVVNEQFLGFRNNWKFRLFTQKWEQMLWYTVVNNFRNYPDGFEIGVAALESKMTWNWHMFPPLVECFYFYAKYSDYKYIKF